MDMENWSSRENCCSSLWGVRVPLKSVVSPPSMKMLNLYIQINRLLKPIKQFHQENLAAERWKGKWRWKGKGKVGGGL